MEMGERIRKLRKENGLTQTELAEKVQTTKQNIYKYEKGIITNIPPDKIEALAEALNTTPAYLTGWDDPGSLETEILETLAQLDDKGKRLFLDILKATNERTDKFLESGNNSIEDQLELIKQLMIMSMLSKEMGKVQVAPLDINILPPESRTFIEKYLKDYRQVLLAREGAKDTDATPTKSTGN